MYGGRYFRPNRVQMRRCGSCRCLQSRDPGGAPGLHSQAAVSLRVQPLVRILIGSRTPSGVQPVPLECQILSDSM